jgi:NADP-dependent 3-hydroxy acid dehydrogenase YdfG
VTADLTGRRILVTGASSGIGAATARALDAAGARVALMARSTSDLEALADELTDAHVATADVTLPDTLAPAIEAAASALDGLDGLVNAAGVAMTGGLLDGDPQDWRAMFEVNVLGLLEVTRRGLPHLLEADLADVVNVSSMSGRRVASVAMAVYSGSKHAVHAISQGMAQELADTPVRVSLLSPGYVDTPIFEGVDDEYRERTRTTGHAPEAVAAQIAHTIGQPADVRLVETAMVSTSQG